MTKALITSVPFGETSRLPLDILKDANIEYVINPYNKKLTESQLATLVTDFDIIIAGTEVISDKVMECADKLKFISRIGVGLDGVDLAAAKRRNIKVSYTPEAPSPAVAEMTVALMLVLLRGIQVSDKMMHRGEWKRIFGRRIANVKVGMIGVGRIGMRVLRRITSLGTPELLVNDVMPNYELNRELKLEWMTKSEIYKNADIITLHVPMTSLTYNMIKKEELLSMKKDAMIINTSRGGIINEDDLYEVMIAGHLSGAAIDVFTQEPYRGKLSKIDRCLLTSHMGSMSEDCRVRMEVEAVEEAVRFSIGKQLNNPVPQAEYDCQTQGF